MSPFPNLSNDSRPQKAEFYATEEERQHYSSLPSQAFPGCFSGSYSTFSGTSLTASEDSSELAEGGDQGQYSDLTQQWDESQQQSFDGIELPIITEANLYIKNIDYEISDDTLYNVFSHLGEITSHHIIRDATKRSRGFGFMSYKTSEQAKRAIVELNGRFIGKKPIVVMLHIKKEQRRMHKQTMKEAIGPPSQGANYQQYVKQGYQQYDQQSYPTDSYDQMRGGYDHRSQKRPGFDGRDPSFNRPVIGAEYEPHHSGQSGSHPSNHSPPHMHSAGDQDYIQQMRKHQLDIQTQEAIRTEYRIRNRQMETRQLPQGPSAFLPQRQLPGQGSMGQMSPAIGQMSPGMGPMIPMGPGMTPGMTPGMGLDRGAARSPPAMGQQIYQRPLPSQRNVGSVGSGVVVGQGQGVHGQMQGGQGGPSSLYQGHDRTRQPGNSQVNHCESDYDSFPGSRYAPGSPYVTEHSHRQGQVYDAEFEQSIRLLAQQNNDIHHQGQRPYLPNERRLSNASHTIDQRLSRDSSPGHRSHEGTTSLESSTHGPRHECSSRGDFSSAEDFTWNKVGSIDGLGLQSKGNSIDGFPGHGSYFPGHGAVGSTSPSPQARHGSYAGSLVSSCHSLTHSLKSSAISSRSSSVSNEEDCRGVVNDKAFAAAASLALNELSDYNVIDPEDRKSLLTEQLFPLVEAFKPFLARSITEYLVENAEFNELMAVLDTPDLLLPHYIAVALSMMNMAPIISEKN